MATTAKSTINKHVDEIENAQLLETLRNFPDQRKNSNPGNFGKSYLMKKSRRFHWPWKNLKIHQT